MEAINEFFLPALPKLSLVEPPIIPFIPAEVLFNDPGVMADALDDLRLLGIAKRPAPVGVMDFCKIVAGGLLGTPGGSFLSPPGGSFLSPADAVWRAGIAFSPIAVAFGVITLSANFVASLGVVTLSPIFYGCYLFLLSVFPLPAAAAVALASFLSLAIYSFFYSFSFFFSAYFSAFSLSFYASISSLDSSTFGLGLNLAHSC